MNIWVVSSFSVLEIKLLGTLVYKFLPRHMFLFLLGIYLGVELLVTDHSLGAKGLA